MSPFRRFERHPRGDLSAYADGQLAPNRRERVDRHLATCDACGAELASVRHVRSALRELPEAAAPRSFALRPDQVAAPVRREENRTLPVFVAMRVAGAGVAAALAVFVLIDGGGTTTDMERSAGDASFELLNSGGEAGAGDGDDRQAQGSVPGSALEDAADETDMDGAFSDDNAGSTGSAGGPSGADAPTGLGAQYSEAAAPTAADAEQTAGDARDAAPTKADVEQPADDTLTAGGADAGDGSDGLSTTTIIQLSLAALAVAAVAGSFVLPRVIQRND